MMSDNSGGAPFRYQIGEDAVRRANMLLAGIPGGVEKAIKSALPRAASALQTGTAKAIQEKYDISSANLRNKSNIRVKYNNISVNIEYRGTKIPLYRYNGTSPKYPKLDSKTVNAVLSGQWRKVHPNTAAYAHQLKSTSPKRFNNAFTAKMKSGHIGIFERTGGVTSEGSDEMKEIKGSSIPQMLGNKEVADTLKEAAAKKFDERMEHEITRILNGWGDSG